MVPIVISTYPENGSTDVALDRPIVITFADSIDPATAGGDHIRLENLNDHRCIDLDFSYNAQTNELTITPSDDKYGNLLLGLVDYRLTMANISSSQAELMQGLHILEFSTVSDSVEDVIDPPDQVVFEELFVVNTYPKQESYGTTPSSVKVKFNHSIDPNSVNENTFVITSDRIEDANDIGFIDITAVTGMREVIGNIISFTPYQEFVEDIGTGSQLEEGILNKTFKLLHFPVIYAEILIDKVTVTADIDYTIDLNTGTIVFLDGHEPEEGKIVSSIVRQPEKLSDNKRYSVLLSEIKDTTGQLMIEPLVYSFYTAFVPAYITPSDVMANFTSIAIIVEGTDPASIYEIIRENSELAYWIAQQHENETEFEWDPPSKVVIEYVKEKTRYDVLFDRYLQLSSEASSKSLGDLEIEYNTNLKDLLSLADKLKLRYEYWENMLKGSPSGKVTPQVFRKGENVDEDPEYKSRAFKDWDGNRSW